MAAEVKDFDATKYMDRKEAKRMDLFCQYGLAAAIQAVEDSGITPEKYRLRPFWCHGWFWYRWVNSDGKSNHQNA